MDTETASFFEKLSHPLQAGILHLRDGIKNSFPSLRENIKWNAPNYQYKDIDFLTFNLAKPKEIRLVLHRGAKVKEALTDNLIDDQSGLLQWAAKDRAILTFSSMDEITAQEQNLKAIIQKWMDRL
ncbi:DUF1801 domain-containing protein [Flavobacterium nitrogenifigens]|uniref:DUF1801 domain-containing protein n=1 Tax=Flavobacterium nitrogenifigens TaxID=1617283 RepID=UPI0031B0E547